ncbi:hypothetical protein BH18ACT12_BH18ACT12_12720 [soil metagenome]
MAVACVAADRSSAIRRLGEALDCRLRDSFVGEHLPADGGIDNLENVVEVVPTDVLAAKNCENVFDVRILAS